jgi:hypothetical protein
VDDDDLFSPEFSVARDGALAEVVTGARGGVFGEVLTGARGGALAEVLTVARGDAADVVGVDEGVVCDARVGAVRLWCLSCGACLWRYSLSGTSDIIRILVN